MRVACLVITILMVFSIHVAFAADPRFATIAEAKSQVAAAYDIKPGIFSIDLNGDGTPDLIVTGHRKHFNAHDFYVHSFYIVNADTLDIIEINAHAGDAEKAEFVIYTSPFDGENIVSDVRLLRFDAWPELALVKVRRQITASYADPSDTFLDIYQLTYDETEDRYLFILTQSFKTAARYTNATEAFEELGMQ